MNTGETANFLCECFPHIEQLKIINYIKKNPTLSADELYSIVLTENPIIEEKKTNKNDKTTKSIFTDKGDSLENAIDITEEDVSDDPPHIEVLDEDEEENQQKNTNINQSLNELNKERKSRLNTTKSKPKEKSLIKSSMLADLHEQRIRRSTQSTSRQAPPQPKRKNMKNELEAARLKLKQKWRETTPTARSMTLSDLEKREKLVKNNKAGNWGEDEGAAKPLRGAHTMDSLLYDEERIGRESLRLTNEFRSKNKLPTLKWSQALYKIGRVHSKDMAEGKVPFGHAGFDKRVAAYPMASSSAAENVAWNSGTSEIASTAVNGWIESPGHRKNLLSRHNYCGIGVFRSSNGRFYLTQLFAQA